MIWPTLSGPLCTRLIRLHPTPEDSSEAPLVCDIESVNLLRRPRYEALSYVWGPVSDGHCIDARDAGKLHISRNLANALKHLRLTKKARPLWIDQLCINQRDDEERSQQVSLMSQIFGQAYQVVAWFEAQGFNDPRAVKELIKDLARAKDVKTEVLIKICEGGPAVSTLVSDTLAEQLATIDDPIWWTLSAFLGNPWFRRTWTFQEIILAKNCEILYGGISISWDVLSEACKTMARAGAKRLGQSHDQVVQIEVRRKLLRDLNNTMSLDDLVASTRQRDASDDRDKVFALTGLVQSLKLIPFPIDYSETCCEVYTRLVEHSIACKQSLEILSYVQRHDPPLWPSWCPDWRQPSKVLWHMGAYDYLGRSPYRATNSVTLPIDTEMMTTFLGNGTLALQCLEIGEIVEVYHFRHEITFTRHSHIGIGTTRKVWHESFRGFLENFKVPSDASEPLGKSDRYLEYLLLTSGIHSHFEGRDMLIALCRTIAADALPMSGRAGTPGEHSRAHTTFHKFITWKSTLSSLDEANSDQMYAEYVEWATRCVAGRELVLIKDLRGGHRLGLAPQHAQKRDQVFLVMGATTPLILRNELGYQYLVGEAYIDGLMDGQWLAPNRSLEATWNTIYVS